MIHESNYVTVPVSNNDNETFTVNSRYRIIRKVGSGAYGTVCSAFDTQQQDYCAIKKIHRPFDKRLVTKRCLREIKLLRLFKDHPRIIELIDMDYLSTNDEVYLMFNCMDASLHDVIHSQQPLDTVHSQWFLYQLLSGIKYIHEANVIHRDLKPANILVNRDCDIRIADFGMARSFDQTNSAYYLTEYVTTRWYRAPEVMISSQNYSKAIDMWSIGCIFAEILGRKVIFQGRDHVDQLFKILGILGLPKDISFWEPSENILHHLQSICTVDGSPPPSEPVDFKLLFPDANDDAINLLTQLLNLNPYNRITVEEAIQHRYLQAFADPAEESLVPPLSLPHLYDFEQTNNDQDLKDMIIEEIHAFNICQEPRDDSTRKRYYTMAITEDATTHKLNYLPSATMSIIEPSASPHEDENVIYGDNQLVGEPEELDEDDNYDYLCGLVKTTPGVSTIPGRELKEPEQTRDHLEKVLSGTF